MPTPLLIPLKSGNVCHRDFQPDDWWGLKQFSNSLEARNAACVSSSIALPRQPNQHQMVDEPQITEERARLWGHLEVLYHMDSEWLEWIIYSSAWVCALEMPLLCFVDVQLGSLATKSPFLSQKYFHFIIIIWMSWKASSSLKYGIFTWQMSLNPKISGPMVINYL